MTIKCCLCMNNLRSGVDLILLVLNPHPRTAGLLGDGDQAEEGEESRDSDGISGLLGDGHQCWQQLGGHREMSLYCHYHH